MRGVLLDPKTGRPEAERAEEEEHVRDLIRMAEQAPGLVGSFANDSVLVTPGSGATVATQLANGKEHQVVMLAASSGHIYDTLPTYYYWSPYDAGAQNEIVIDLFNGAGSGKTVRVKRLFLQHNMAAITGVGHLFDVDLTSAVGTGGTAVTGRPADPANAAIPAQITCRHAATGGATKDFTLFGVAVDPEETRPGAALMAMINWVPEGPSIQEIVLPEGDGVRMIQITASTVGVWGVLLVVTLE